MPYDKKKIKIAIVGGGAAGVCAALVLRMRGYSVGIFDRNNELMNETSRKTPGRMTSGFHYAHQETAIICLRSIIALIKKYPGFRRGEEVGHELPEDHPMRRGRYFILKKTNIPKEAILTTYAALEAEYQRLIQEDPANNVFGDHLYHFLNEEEYANDVAMDQVDVGIETREHLMNFESFRTFLINELEKHGVECQLNHTWVDSRLTDNGQYQLVFRDKDNQEVTEEADLVINATWSNIEKMNQKAGFAMAVSEDAKELLDPRANRLKVLAKIDLPVALHAKNHMFFCMGPLGCMFSNNGDGTGFITCAEITNMAVSTGLEMNEIGFKRPPIVCVLKDFLGRQEKFKEKDEIVFMHNGNEIIVQAGEIYRAKQIADDQIRLVYRSSDPNKVYEVVDLPLTQELSVQQGVSIQDVLAGQLTADEQQLLGEKLIAGVAKRIPAMQQAVLKEVRFGIVQTEGDYTPDNAQSRYNERNYYGFGEEALGWLTAAGVKLMFTPFAAEMIADLAEKQLALREAILQVLHPDIAGIFFLQIGSHLTYQDYENEKTRYKNKDGVELSRDLYAKALVDKVNRSIDRKHHLLTNSFFRKENVSLNKTSCGSSERCVIL